MNLQTSLTQVDGIGPSLAYKLSRLNLSTVGDLIYHFPFRYDDFSRTVDLKDAQINQIITLKGEIWSIKNVYTRSKKILTKAIFNDGTMPLELTWFNQSWLTKQIATGDRLQISGKLTKYQNSLAIISPRWEKIAAADTSAFQSLHTGKLVAVYPETQGLTSKWLRTKIAMILPQIQKNIKDPLPDFIRGEMLPLKEAIQKIHFPNSWLDGEKSRERLGFDELFYVSLATQKIRNEWRNKPTVKSLQVNLSKVEEFIQNLPFSLTMAQLRVIKEAVSELKRNRPMNRMIQGEVGSGKTVVAAVIIYLIYLNKLKTLFMAPTEILAFQHYSTISHLLAPFDVKVGIYTGSKKSLQPNSDVIVGTHALLSPKLNIKNVGLVIVDEQQRFGVEQRTYLRNRAKLPHFLTATATPIPRTVALTLYGDLDLSIIDEMPKNRLKIKTYVVPGKKRADAYKFIEKKIKEGDQAYIITPLIEQSETLLSAKAAKVEFEKLKKIFPNLKLGLLHGRLKGKEKDEIMQKFKDFQIDILVSTSVVEVGVDVTNATIMLIESAERFGLAQLHQLRGRVGRGDKQSYCLLFTEADSSQNSNRLKNLEKIDNGLQLAELDLKIRGGGEIFGFKQAGRFEFKIASFSNLSLVQKARKAAADLLSDNPTLDKYPALKAKLEELAAEVMPD